MLKSYIKLAIRHLSRNKFYSAINIIGLAIGITCALLIGLYIKHEVGYDTFHEKHERIYRVESHFTIKEKDDKFALTALPLVPTMKDEFPEIEETVRFRFTQNRLYSYENRKFYDDHFYFADSTVFKLFSYKFLLGNPQKALLEPNTVVLTKSFADKIFGNENPIGKTLNTGFGILFTITGVIKDLPENTHFKFTGLLSMNTLVQLVGEEQFNARETQNFWNISVYSYILIKKNTNIHNIQTKFKDFYDKYMKELGDKINTTFNIRLTPLSKTHFVNDLQWDRPSGNRSYIYIFTLVAFFIVIIACINYMNLATARSTNRALEVGIRKVVGAAKTTLIKLFICESIILAFISLIIAILLTYLLIPTFQQLSGIDVSLDFGNNSLMIVYIIIATIIVGLISGSYPAFYLSSFKPVLVLKSKLISSKGSGVLRKILVLIQFSISIVMLIVTFSVAKQLNYIQNKDLGFEKENRMILSIQDTTAIQNLSTIRDELSKHPDIFSAAVSTSVPGEYFGKLIMFIEIDDEMQEQGLNLFVIDENFFPTMGMEIVEGRNFSDSIAADRTTAVIVNEAAVKEFAWDEPLGKKVNLGRQDDGTAIFDGKVIGVVKNFNYASLHNKIEPLMIFGTDFPKRNIILHINYDKTQEVISFVKEKWEEFNPGYPFDYSFLDERLNTYYIPEQKLAMIFTYFAILCIFIACLGLFGLASYTTERRTREIGIRKVMGATSRNIVFLLSKTFTKWVLLANIIAWPVAYFALKKWLINFAYRTHLSVFIFILSALIAIFIAIITVLYQSLKASQTNPSITLKYE